MTLQTPLTETKQTNKQQKTASFVVACFLVVACSIASRHVPKVELHHLSYIADKC